MSGIIVYCRRMVGRLRMSMLATLFGSNLSRDQPKSQHSTACNFVFLARSKHQAKSAAFAIRKAWSEFLEEFHGWSSAFPV